MNIEEAYKILGVQSSISDADLKIKYRLLAKEKHPDKGGDQNEFKKINEAHQFILDYREHPEKHQQFDNTFVNFNDIFNHFGGVRRAPVQDINISINVSFKESILGVEKPIKFNHKIACTACNATGGKKVSNGCDGCDGFGRVVKQTGNMTFQQNCNKCYGRNVKTEKCSTCKGVQSIQKEENGVINVPPGVDNGTTLRMDGAGNFIQMSPFGMEASALLINISVSPDKEMRKEGNNVVSEIEMPLLDALNGKNVMVNSVFGEKEISVPALSKNGQFVSIAGAGVGGKGNHKVYLNVQYPNNIEKFKQMLEGI